MSTTSIEWTDRVWNPVTGCQKVSPGCKHCYAEGVAHRAAGALNPKCADPAEWPEDLRVREFPR